MDLMNEHWIDLAILMPASQCHYGFVVIYKYNELADDTLHYCLRQALRTVGHKITRIENVCNADKIVRTAYYTTITAAEGKRMDNLWSGYMDMTVTEIDTIDLCME